MLTDGKSVWHWFLNYHKDHVSHINKLLLFFEFKTGFSSHKDDDDNHDDDDDDDCDEYTMEKCVKKPKLISIFFTSRHQWVEMFFSFKQRA